MMFSRTPSFLLGAAAFVCWMAPAAAAPFSAPSQLPPCAIPEYPDGPQYPHPRRSVPDSDEGITFVAFLVRTDGTVDRSVIVNSSGFKDQDRNAAEAGSACLYKPATDAGKPIEAWAPVKYVWTMEGDPEMMRAKRNAALAARKGDLAALYQLSLLLSVTAKTDADRQQALTVLRTAAQLGYAPAQSELGRGLERGKEMKADIEAAMRWYQKAAAQGDVLAIQRLHLGALPD